MALLRLSTSWRLRLRAAAIHAAATVCVAVLVCTLVFVVWYPNVYRDMSGGAELVILVISVDLVLGPLITLAVFDRRKPWPVLRRDLTVIVLLQVSGLAYGLHTVFIARPVALALEEDRFRVVAAVDVRTVELPEALPPYRRLSLTGPELVSSSVPTDPDKKFEAIGLGLSGFDIGTRPSLWRPWDADARKAALQHAKPLDNLRKRHPAQRADIDAAITATRRPSGDLLYLPVIALRGDWVALLDRADGSVVGFAPVDGF